MAYTKTTWVNNSAPALNATNLNKIETGIYDAHNTIGTGTLATANKTLIGAINEHESDIIELNNLVGSAAGWYNSIFRGKSLGNALTSAQSAAIQNGTFTDLFIGDYWTINNVKWRIAAFDPYYNCGDTNLNLHHIAVVPDTVLYSHIMNDTNITDGGYAGSKMRSEGLADAISAVNNAFGSDHVIQSHRIIMTNAVSSGKPSGWAWMDSLACELLTEMQVYGARAWGNAAQSGYDVGTQNFQLPLFALDPTKMHTRQNYWLQDVVSAASFARVTYDGFSVFYYASYSYGVRPLSLIR